MSLNNRVFGVFGWVHSSGNGPVHYWVNIVSVHSIFFRSVTDCSCWFRQKLVHEIQPIILSVEYRTYQGKHVVNRMCSKSRSHSEIHYWGCSFINEIGDTSPHTHRLPKMPYVLSTSNLLNHAQLFAWQWPPMRFHVHDSSPTLAICLISSC